MYCNLNNLIEALIKIRNENPNEEKLVKLCIDLDDYIEGQTEVYNIRESAGTVYIEN